MNLPRFRAIILFLPLFVVFLILAPAPVRACNSAITVTNNANSGAGSLRQALADVCPDGTITFSGDYTITLASGLVVYANMTIDGTGRNVTVSGNNTVQVLKVSTGATVNLKNLTVTNGRATYGGGIYVEGGTLNLASCTISGNSAGRGGGIFSEGTLNVTACTISGNSAGTGQGGGIESMGPLTVTNSTITGNSAGNGGGIYNWVTMAVTNSTISGNSATQGGGIYFNSGASPVTMTNSIIAKGTTGGNCYGFNNNNGFNNLADDDTCPGFTNSASLLLGALGNYGGRTQTIPLLSGSAAINAGNSSTCASAPVNSLDQRGLPRPKPDGENCDIGAFEAGACSVDMNCTGGYKCYTSSQTCLPPLAVNTPGVSPEPSNEGASVTAGAGFSGAAAPYTCTVNYGDGSGDQAGTVIGMNCTGPAHTYANSGSYTVTVTVLHGALSQSGTTSHTVNNIAPTATFTAPASGRVGQPLNISLTSPSDPSPADTAAGFTYAFDCGTGYGQYGTLNSAACTPTSAGSLTVKGKIRDKDGGEREYTAAAVVCGPSITVTGNADSGAGSLRQALVDVCPDGTIAFNGDYTITLTSGQLTIAKNMTIDCAGHNVTVSGDYKVRVFYVNSGVTADLRHLFVEHGASDYGGGIYNNGTLNVTNCTIESNSARENGGGIYNTSTLNATNSTISYNSALVSGGGIFSTGNLNLTNSTISGNSTTTGNGGGIYKNGTLIMTNSMINMNSASGYGGGIYNNSGTLNVTNSTISDNSTSAGDGGGIFGGTITVTNSTIANNHAADGGGVHTSSMTVTNSTISGNSAGSGGGIYTSAGSITNSIIANSSSGGNCSGSFSGSHNLSDDNTCGSGFTNSPSILLGPLDNYGAGTQTIPLLPGSAAIDVGDSATCSNVAVNNLDQRGRPRPAGHCDIGAFESQGFSLTKTGGDNQSAVINTAFATPLGLTVTASNTGEPVYGGTVTFTAPSSGPSATPQTFIATIGDTGSAAATVTANGMPGGPYSVDASTAGAANVNFSLMNVAGLATLTIDFAGSGSGTVSSTSPATPSIDCIKGSSSGCSASYPINTPVTLSATGDWKSLFGGWSGAGNSNPETFAIDTDKKITATFEPNYKVRLLPGGALFAAIQDAYASVSPGTLTIQTQSYSFLEELLFNNSSNVILNGGMDSGYNPTAGYSTVKSLTVGAGQAVISNIIIK